MAEGLEIPRSTERELSRLQELAPSVQLPAQIRSLMAVTLKVRFRRKPSCGLHDRALSPLMTAQRPS